MDPIKQYQETQKRCHDCDNQIKVRDTHIMSMKPGGIRVYRCRACGMKHIQTVGGKHEN